MNLPSFVSRGNKSSRIIIALVTLIVISSLVPASASPRGSFWSRWYRHHPVAITTTTTTAITTTTTTAITTTTTTAPSTTTTKPSTTTTRPATTTTIAPSGTNGNQFPSSASAGVPSNISLTTWPSNSFRSDAVKGTTETVDGITYTVISNYLIDIPAGGYMYVTGSNVLFRNSRFIGHGVPSNTSALVQANSATNVRFDSVDVYANGYSRGIQSDTAHLIVNNSKFINTSDSAVEKNDTRGATDLTVTNNYIEADCSWVKNDPGAHTDGIQWGAARNVVIRNNTILIQINSSCTSNSAIGGWAELGNVNSSVIDHNYMAGGGATVYMQQKESYKWGNASFTNNVFDRRYGGGDGMAIGSTSGRWCALNPQGLPSSLTWSNNTWDNGVSVSFADAKKGC